ncbi:hypothetical protein [Salinibacter ruber]|uniref:hypothetical protein n=1 Tax=Salinibacter ruber TaxID=146919 RepID=UPI002073EEE2|nr:hypothetical protein [Salinibacter ruber]MCS3755215.1 hypothetical protein [Salinibacter ruber]
MPVRYLPALFATLLLFAAPSTFAQQGAPVEPGQTFSGLVVDVTDGDTFGLRRSVGAPSRSDYAG